MYHTHRRAACLLACLPVPQRDDAVGHARVDRVAPALLLARRGEQAGQPKVGDLQLALVVDQQVGVLQVAVQHALDAQQVQPLEQLAQVALDLRAWV